MQAKQMAASLRLLAPLAGPEAAETIVHLADALAVEGSKPFRSLAAKLEKGLKSRGFAPDQSAASLLVRRIAEASGAAGSGALAKDFDAAARILEALSSVATSRIAAVAAEALTSPPAKAKGAKVPPVDPRELADRLVGAAQDNATFDALIEELKKLPKDTLADIARRFLGTTRQFKSKPEIIKSMRARQLQDALDASRDRRISKIAV